MKPQLSLIEADQSQEQTPEFASSIALAEIELRAGDLYGRAVNGEHFGDLVPTIDAQAYTVTVQRGIDDTHDYDRLIIRMEDRRVGVFITSRSVNVGGGEKSVDMSLFIGNSGPEDVQFNYLSNQGKLMPNAIIASEPDATRVPQQYAKEIIDTITYLQEQSRPSFTDRAPAPQNAKAGRIAKIFHKLRS